MARRSSILGAMAKSYKTKANNAARQGIYKAMWREEPPKRYKKVKIKWFKSNDLKWRNRVLKILLEIFWTRKNRYEHLFEKNPEIVPLYIV